ncbi:BMC domain-containing protein [Clostridium sporogenes]|uniref:BMC domain-containing protein n=1 Tax=Clostridium sporogenes TaxID=1509 RepID=A0AAE4JRE5_CLOSG|nr:BMC domain-containing protein [Clostridium sporogenes]MDS1002320.1 BMC domain-containing protein [Clostridium sporogenes]
MDIKALGLIEVRGYLGAIEAADSALKAASVELIGCEKIKGGIVTVKITGDVGAVQAAVEAGAKTSQKLKVFRHSHVIPRLHEDTLKILLKDKKDIDEDRHIDMIKNEFKYPLKGELDEQSLEKKETLNIDDVVKKTTPEKANKAKDTLISKEEKDSKNSLNDIGRIPSIEELKDLRVKDLRRLASKLKISSMTNKQIKFAKKDMLIENITDFLKEES